MNKITRSIILNAPREKAYEVIADFESYPEFLPEITDVEIKKKSAKEVIAIFTVNVVKEIGYTLKIKLAKPTGVSWELIEGELMSHNSGSWKLTKISPKKTRAKYTIDVKFGSFVPGFISNMLVQTSLPAMLDRFKDRIESRV